MFTSMCPSGPLPAALRSRNESVASLSSRRRAVTAHPAASSWGQSQQQQHHSRPQLAVAASYNPQNVEQCQTPPSPEHTAEQAVAIQLTALQRNDEPWGNHGVQTAYEWALDVGGLDPSMYFGFSKDLYHFDHFMGMFANRLGQLINCAAFAVEGVEERPASDGAPPTTVVTAAVTPAQGGEPCRFEFHLRRKGVGARKGSLMTYMVRRVEQE